jgi:hypothetical protein
MNDSEKIFLKKQFEKLDKLGIIHIGVVLLENYDDNNNYVMDEHDRYQKKVAKQSLINAIRIKHSKIELNSAYIGKKLETLTCPSYNSCVIPLGEQYNLIGIDVNNINNTIEMFSQICEEDKINLDTLTFMTINNGYHFYYLLSNIQMKILKNFTYMKNALFGLDINIAYNNNFLFGPSVITIHGNIHKNKIINSKNIAQLPDQLFDELTANIIKIHNKQILITQYLNCLSIETCENNTFKISKIIFNETASYKIFNEWAKKFSDYYENYDEYKSIWNNLKKIDNKLNINSNDTKINGDRNDDNDDSNDPFKLSDDNNDDDDNDNNDNNESKKKDDKCKKNNIYTMKLLKQMAVSDNKEKYFRIIYSDINETIDTIYDFGFTGDQIFGELINSLFPKKFICDGQTDILYCMNNYGIYMDGSNDHNSVIHDIIKTHVFGHILDNYNSRQKNKKNKSTYNNIIKTIWSAYKKNSIIKELKLICKIPGLFLKMNNVNNYLFAFDNGVYDITNKIFRNADPEEYISYTCGYEYGSVDNNIKEEIKHILSTIFPHENERIYALKMIATALINDNFNEEFYIFSLLINMIKNNHIYLLFADNFLLIFLSFLILYKHLLQYL